MYTFISALLRKKGKNQRFQQVNLTNVKMSALYSTYRDGYIELSNPSLRNNIFVKLTDLKADGNLVYTDSFFPVWLSVQGNKTITGSVIKPKMFNNQIAFSDAVQAGCEIKRVRQSDLAGTTIYPPDMTPDVFLYKTLSDYTLMQRYILTTVNGLCHINIPAQRGILIKDAGKSLDIEQDNLIGIMSFENVGEIKQMIITDNMLDPLEQGETYRKAVLLNLGANLKGKSLMFSFCGRLFVADDLIQRINDQGAVRINLHKLDIVQILHESLGKIDLSSLELDERLYKTRALKLGDVIDDDVILAMLKLTQTFFIIVDTPTLYKETIPLVDTRLPGIFEKYQNYKLPYISDTLMLQPYWKKIHVGAYTTVYRFHLKDTFYKSPLYRNGGYQNPGTWVHDNYEFTSRPEYNTGHLLNIFSEQLQYEEV